MSVSVEDRFLAAVERPGQWQTVRIADVFSSSDLESIREKLQVARAILDAFEGILDAVGAFTAILRALESFINDVLLSAMLAIIEALETSVNQFKSTGVYALDLITPFMGDDTRVGDACDVAILDNPLKDISLQIKDSFERAATKAWKRQTYEQFIQIIINAFLDENDLPSAYLSQQVLKTFITVNSPYAKQSSEELDKQSKIVKSNSLLNNAFRPGRPDFGDGGNLKFYLLVVTAQDFTQFANIILSFSKFFGDILGNHNAVKELILRTQAYKYCLTKSFRKQAIESYQTNEDLVNIELNEAQSSILGYDEIKALVGDVVANSTGSNDENVLYTESIQTQIESITKGDLTRSFANTINDLRIAMSNKQKSPANQKADARNRVENARLRVIEIEKSIADKKTEITKIQQRAGRLAVEKSTVTNNIKSLPAPDKTNPYIKTICGNDDGTMDENALDVQKRFKAARGNKEIDFYGLSAYQLFPGLFDAIEELLQKVKSYAKPIRTGISDLIDNIIRAIKEEINNLRQIIDVIERIIQFIEDFLNLNGVSLLALDTTNGTYGLVNQLQNAQGFQGQGTNKEMFFAGIMVGVGYPGLGDTNNVFTNVGAVFEAQKSRIEGSANDLDKLNTKAVNNATEAFNKFSQFFK
jgi:hypothetical protein